MEKKNAAGQSLDPNDPGRQGQNEEAEKLYRNAVKKYGTDGTGVRKLDPEYAAGFEG